MNAEEHEALVLCIRDARERRAGLKASTSQWALLIEQISRDLRATWHHGVIKYSERYSTRCSNPRACVDGYTFTHGHVELVVMYNDLAYIHVADEEVYRRSGLGLRGEHCDVSEAAQALRAEAEKALVAEREAHAEHERKLAAAQALLASRGRTQ